MYASEFHATAVGFTPSPPLVMFVTDEVAIWRDCGNANVAKPCGTSRFTPNFANWSSGSKCLTIEVT